MAYYLLRRPDTAISKLIYRLLNIVPPIRSNANSPAFICALDYHLADFLWAYALTHSLNIVSIKVPDKLGTVFALSIFMCCAIELLQGAGIVIGTYDPVDIIIQICAALIAEIIFLISFGKEV